jgi:hypothetical protein
MIMNNMPFRIAPGVFRDTETAHHLPISPSAYNFGTVEPFNPRCSGGFVRHALRNAAAHMNWFRVSKGRLEYRGRITRDPFTAWTSTPEGQECIQATATTIRFALFGRERAARKQVWRALENAARDEQAIGAIAVETTHYMKLLANLSYVQALPRVQVGLHRLVVVPRTMIAGRGYNALCSRLAKVPALAALDEPSRAFLFEQLLREMDYAVAKTGPTPRRPVHAHEEWACVGVDLELIWVDPMWSGPGWGGHLFMYELPRAGLSRKDLKAVEAALAALTKNIAALSRVQRDNLLRSARAS